jgi:glycerophosphoryl diester phosphodiesterase
MTAAGVSVIAWTVNSESEIRRLTTLGVHGICGNYPDLIRENSRIHA